MTHGCIHFFMCSKGVECFPHHYKPIKINSQFIAVCNFGLCLELKFFINIIRRNTNPKFIRYSLYSYFETIMTHLLFRITEKHLHFLLYVENLDY